MISSRRVAKGEEGAGLAAGPEHERGMFSDKMRK